MDRKNKAKQEEEKKRERQKKNEDRSVSTSTQGTYTVPPQNPAPGLGVLTSHWLLLYDLLLQVWPFWQVQADGFSKWERCYCTRRTSEIMR